MQKAFLILILLAAVAFFSSGSPKSESQETDQVTFYAKVKTLSTSGSTAFYHYDRENQKTDCDREECWFWGMPRQAEDDQKAMEYFRFMSDREGLVFKVTGVKEAPDCTYTEGKCFESLILDRIEAVREL